DERSRRRHPLQSGHRLAGRPSRQHRGGDADAVFGPLHARRRHEPSVAETPARRSLAGVKCEPMDTRGTVRTIFGARRALIGVIHVGALPGTPDSRDTVDTIAAAAVADARAYREAGFAGLMVENMHDRPYLRREVGPEIVAAMTV